MTRTKKVLLLVALFVILPLPWHQQAESADFVEITKVFTSDYAGNSKTVFHPGDNVRYHVEFNLIVAAESKVIAKGVAKGPRVKSGGEEGLFKTQLEKQAEVLDSGSYTLSWDESIPVSARAGLVSYKIKVKLKDVTKDTGSGLLTVEPSPSKIAFNRVEIIMDGDNVIENPDIWIMNPDGSDQVRLTFDLADDKSPSISPNGSQIAFASDRAGNFDIWLLDLETENLTQLTVHPADDLQPQWSHDGKKIAFSSKRGGSRDVWVLDVDFGDLQQLTDSNFKEKGPKWSPNDKRIAYVSDKDGNDDIFIMRADGRRETQLTFEIGDQRAVSWSPATKEIAFVWWPFSKARANIYAMDKNGQNIRQITSEGFYDRGPDWSPNGGRIAFFSNRGGNFDIWSMKHDGSEMIQLTMDPNFEMSADWAKTGFSEEWIADTEVTTRGRRNIVYVGTVHLAEGGALHVEMSWDDGADLDLGILERDGTLITWKNPEGLGRHKGNVNPGPGMEVYTLSGASQGDYLIGAYYKNFETTAHWRIRWRDGSFEPTVTTSE